MVITSLSKGLCCVEPAAAPLRGVWWGRGGGGCGWGAAGPWTAGGVPGAAHNTPFPQAGDRTRGWLLGYILKPSEPPPRGAVGHCLAGRAPWRGNTALPAVHTAPARPAPGAVPSLRTRILPSSTEDSCFLVPRFCWRRRGKETANQEKKPTLSKRETFPCHQTLVGGGQPSSGPCSRLTPAIPGAIQPPEVFAETNNWTRRYVGRCRPPRSQTLRTRL